MIITYFKSYFSEEHHKVSKERISNGLLISVNRPTIYNIYPQTQFKHKTIQKNRNDDYVTYSCSALISCPLFA